MQSTLDHILGSRLHLGLLASCAAIALCAACAAPRRQPLSDPGIAASVLSRNASVADMQTALALADLGPLGVPRPDSPAATDPSNPAFWHACAYLYEPSVRQARRRLEARRALAKGAGAVPSIDASVDHVRNDPDHETEAMATFDLLALLGLGPSAAAKELARAEVCEALGELESAVWAAYFRVVRARIRLTAALEREAAAAAIVQEASEDQTRIEILERGGRAVPAEIAWAGAFVQRIEEERARARVAAAEALEELALASGLPSGHPAMDHAAGSYTIGDLRPDGVSPRHAAATTDPLLLLSRVPKLRALKMKYAVAEAQVRSAAAATWPGVAIGPKLTVIPDDYLAGGILDLSLPLPGATMPALRAAIVERTAARERIEDELAAVLARNHSLNRRATELRSVVKSRVHARRTAAEDMWRAARARFRSDEKALTGWVLGLEMRLEAALSAIGTGESIELLEADVIEASGPAPEGPSVMELGPGLPRVPTETRPQ